MNIYEHGHWDGDKFIFNEPIELPNGHVMKKIDLSVTQGLEDSGISREDVVHAMLTAYAVEPATELGEQFTTWHNPLTREEAENFYEEDEDPREVWAAFERGVKGVTAPPPERPQDLIEGSGRKGEPWDRDRENYEFYLNPEHQQPAGPPVRRSGNSPPGAPETSESPPHPELPVEE